MPTRTSNCLLEFETEVSDLILEDNSGFLALEICPEDVVARPGGGAGFVHAFTRKRWRELEMLIAAEAAAMAKANRLTKPEKAEPLYEAAEAARAAILAAEIEGENKRLDELLVRNAKLIRDAIRASTQVKLQKEAVAAVEISRVIAARRQQEDDEEMISLLMLS